MRHNRNQRRHSKNSKKEFHPKSRSRAKKHQAKNFSKTYQGIVQKNPRGFGFVVSPLSEFEDTYLSPNECRNLLSGDMIEFRIESRRGEVEGKVLKLIERKTSEIVGQVVQKKDRAFFITETGDHFSIDPKLGNLPNETWVIGHLNPDQVNQIEKIDILGKELTPADDVRITVAKYGLATDFPKVCDVEAEQMRSTVAEEIANPHRKDLRNLAFVTIDGEDAKDFDDAVYAVQDAKGFTLWVAIADVSYYVRPGSHLDQQAQDRATSVYFPGICLPMLPKALSEDLCSLVPQTDKLTMTAEISLDERGKIVGSKVYTSTIRSVARLTYRKVQDYWDKKPHSIPKECETSLSTLIRLYGLRRKIRAERGTLDFDLQEAFIEVDKQGNPIHCYPYPKWTSHGLIEEMMVAANEVVAHKLRTQKMPSLYRVHEPPDWKNLQELETLCQHLGIPFKFVDNSSKTFAKIIEKTAKHPAKATLHQAFLRAQKQAHYEPDPKGHFGLALQDYTHFTSPIRRYPDLIVHRSLKRLGLERKNADENGKGSAPRLSHMENLEKLGLHTSLQERRSMEAERYIKKRKHCWFLLDKVGETFPGMINGCVEAGLFVSLEKFLIEGFIPVQSLPGFFQFDARRNQMIQRRGEKRFSLGDKIEVTVERVEMESQRITFGLATLESK